MKDATCIGGQGRLSGGTETSRMIPMDKISKMAGLNSAEREEKETLSFQKQV